MKPAPPPAAGRWYEGRRDAERRTAVLVHEPAAGWAGPLVHFVRHSPAGFEWGYGGSGPADLARALIIDALGAAAVCPGCNGTHKMVLDPDWTGDPSREPAEPYNPARHAAADPLSVVSCLCCDDGIRRLPYHDFKFAVVARWQADTWTYSRAEILEELTTYYPPGAVPDWLHDVVTGATE